MKPTVTITQLEFERNPNQFLWRAHFGTHFDIILESGTIICLTPPTNGIGRFSGKVEFPTAVATAQSNDSLKR